MWKERGKEGKREGGKAEITRVTWKKNLKRITHSLKIFFHPQAKIALLYKEALSFDSSFSLLCPLLPLHIPFSLSGLVQNSSSLIPPSLPHACPGLTGLNEHTHYTSEQGHGAASSPCF